MSLPLLAIGLHDEGILWEIIKKKKKKEWAYNHRQTMWQEGFLYNF